MIQYFYKSLRSPRVQETNGIRRGVWLHAEDPSDEETQRIASELSVDPTLLMDALDEDEVPRLERRGDDVYVYVRASHVRRSGQFDTLPLLVVFTGNVLLTVCKRPLTCLDDFKTGKLTFATTQRTKLFLQIMQRIVDEYDGRISVTSKQIKVIRARLRGHEINSKDFLDFVTIEDELNEFMSALVPNNAALRRLSIGKHITLFAEDQDIVDDLLLSTDQSVEASRANIKSIVNIRQAYSAISAHNLNRTIKILTVATVLISFPNTIFGMYGMNVDLPFQNHIWAYGSIIGTVVLLLVVMYFVLRKKRII